MAQSTRSLRADPSRHFPIAYLHTPASSVSLSMPYHGTQLQPTTPPSTRLLPIVPPPLNQHPQPSLTPTSLSFLLLPLRTIAFACHEATKSKSLSMIRGCLIVDLVLPTLPVKILLDLKGSCCSVERYTLCIAYDRSCLVMSHLFHNTQAE